jgi:hypothetical protein
MTSPAPPFPSPDVKRAEFAVRVGDSWKNRGAESLSADRCTEIARGRPIREIRVDMPPENRKTMDMLRRREFSLKAQGRVMKGHLRLQSLVATKKCP